METAKISNSLAEGVKEIISFIGKNYSKYMNEEVENHIGLLETCPGFFLNPEKIYIYIGTTHIGIEYDGPERVTELSNKTLEVKLQCNDYLKAGNNLMEEIIGFKFPSDGIYMPLMEVTENLKFPTSKGMDKLIELKRNFGGEDCVSIIGNARAPSLEKGEIYRLINCFFYDEENGSLKTRHIKRLDLIPLEYDILDNKLEKIKIHLPYSKEQALRDIHYEYPLPNEYKYDKLRILNRFVEIYGDQENSETEITSFLAKKENSFILTMNFGGKELHSEKICKWQSEVKEDIRPDFLIENPNGYCDIIEFKLPYLKGNLVVGKNNRKAFSAELNSYIAQTRTYEEYFNDPNNRNWVEEQYGIKVYKPRRILIIGRRCDLSIEEWIDIKNDYRNLNILTYDDIKDGTIAQLYM